MRLCDAVSPAWMVVKAALFVVTGVLSSMIVLVRVPEWTTLALLAIAVWAFCRAYYFAFYVVEAYAEPGEKITGLTAFVFRRLSSRRRRSGAAAIPRPGRDRWWRR